MTAPVRDGDKPREPSDMPRWPSTHDGLCERTEVDIGVGNMLSPCACEIRWYQRELAEAKDIIRRCNNELLPATVEDGWTPEDEDIGKALLVDMAKALGIEPAPYLLKRAARSASGASTVDALVAEFRGKNPRGLAIALADLGRFLEADVAHWKRMYECAQNANSYRSDALDAAPAGT